MDTSAETLLWDPVQRRQYRLTRRSDGAYLRLLHIGIEKFERLESTDMFDR